MEHRASVRSPRSRGTEPLLRRLIGGVLRRRREAQGRTLRDVAEDARVSVAYLSEIERGRKEASSEVLVAVCGALGMRLVDLVAAAYAELTGVPLGVRPEPVAGAPAGAAVLELSGVASARRPAERSGSAPSASVGRAALDAVVLAA